MSIPKTWDTTRAEQMWRDGESGSDIAARVGAPSRSAVIAHMNRNKIERGAGRGRAATPRWTPEKEAKLKRLWGEGWAPSIIADDLKVTTKAVRGKAARLGLGEHPSVIRAAETARRAKEARPVTVQSTKPQKPNLSLVAKADQAPENPATLKTLIERGPRECCWPVGAPDPRRGQLYCAQPVSGGRPYCADHSTAQPGVLKTVRMKDERVRRARPERDDASVELTELWA